MSDGQWQSLQEILFLGPGPTPSRSGDLRAVLNAINYRWRCGCSWRMLPHDFPPWRTVYGHFRRWRHMGVLPLIRNRLTARQCAR